MAGEWQCDGQRRHLWRGSRAITNNVTLSGGTIFNTATQLNWSGTVNITAPSTVLNYDPTSGAAQTGYSTNFTGVVSGSGNLTILGITNSITNHRPLRLQNAGNSYSGIITLSANGILEADSVTALGTATIILAGGQYEPNAANGIFSNAVTVTADSFFDATATGITLGSLSIGAKLDNRVLGANGSNPATWALSP